MFEQSPTPLDRMRSAIQPAGFHYIVCLRARPTSADHRLTIDEKMGYVFDAIRRVLHADFQRWAATVVLRDLIENFSVSLMEVYRNANQANPGANYFVTLDQFECEGIEDQLGVLLNDFSIDAAWTSMLIGYNRARNCLAHRQGIVGSRDTTDGNDLVVRWLVSKTELTSGRATPFVEGIGPMSSLIRAQHIQGGAVRLEVHEKEMRIAVGSALKFPPTGTSDICLTFQMAAGAFAMAASPALHSRNHLSPTLAKWKLSLRRRTSTTSFALADRLTAEALSLN